MFEQASRLKLRFMTVKGDLSAEELWDLPLVGGQGVCLDNLAKEVNRKLKNLEEESFVVDNRKDNVLELKLEILKHIIKTKMQETDDLEQYAIRKSKKERIMALINQKKDEALMGKDVSELEEMLADVS